MRNWHMLFGLITPSFRAVYGGLCL